MEDPRQAAMYQMRQKGATLQQIATPFGISREEVRRQLTKHYGSTRIGELLTSTELAQLAGYPLKYIDKLRRRGVIQPAMVVGKRALWKPEAITRVILYLDRHRCPVCQRPVPSNRLVYCSREHYLEDRRYKNLPEEAKRQHNQRVARWLAEHPEKAREKQRRQQARRSEQRYRSTEYVVCKRCPIPLGTVVRVASYDRTRGRARVEWGEQVLELPFGCVRRVRY